MRLQVIKTLKEHSAFTLIELVVVYVMMATLSATAVPLFQGYNEKAHNSQALSTVRNVTGVVSALKENGENRDWGIYPNAHEISQGVEASFDKGLVYTDGTPSRGPNEVDIDRLDSYNVRVAVASKTGKTYCSLAQSSGYTYYATGDEVTECSAKAIEIAAADPTSPPPPYTENDPIGTGELISTEELGPAGSTLPVDPNAPPFLPAPPADPTPPPEDEIPSGGIPAPSMTAPVVMPPPVTPLPEPEIISPPANTPSIKSAAVLPVRSCGNHVALRHYGWLPTINDLRFVNVFSLHLSNNQVTGIYDLDLTPFLGNIDCYRVEWYVCPVTGTCTFATRADPVSGKLNGYNDFAQNIIAPNNANGDPPISNLLQLRPQSEMTLWTKYDSSRKYCAKLSVVNATGEVSKTMCP